MGQALPKNWSDFALAQDTIPALSFVSGATQKPPENRWQRLCIGVVRN
jgi:hypothetical protein